MEVYLVGGAVRDELLGKKPKDKDFVVTDSTPEEMESLGFQKVGQSFAIYLHPRTREEFALIRGMSLKDDLERRDLTINAMAKNNDGKLYDPFHGKKDLENKVLRHVSSFFAEDPLRIFRIARFKAWLPEFSIAEETKIFIERIINTPDFVQISGERIFKEMKSALEALRPSLFFETLKDLVALHFHFSELDRLSNEDWCHTMKYLDDISRNDEDILVRYSVLLHLIAASEIKRIGDRLKVPNDWTEAAVVASRFHAQVQRIQEMKSSSIVQMFYEMDAFRKPNLVKILSKTCEVKEAGRYLEECFEKIRNVKLDASQSHLTGKAIGDEIKEKRVRTLTTGVD
jgi:tRNA nucleotidyltransferase (CCA-adding enzyme)